MYRPEHLVGSVLRSKNTQIFLTPESEAAPATTMKGSGLEKMSDKLENLIIKPKKKVQNIKFNP